MPVAIIDNKKRITLKEARPGEVYDVEFIGGGHFRLRRMQREPEPKDEAPEGNNPQRDEIDRRQNVSCEHCGQFLSICDCG